MKGRAVATMVRSRLAVKKAGSKQHNSFQRYLRAALFSATHSSHFGPVEPCWQEEAVGALTEADCRVGCFNL